MIDLFFLKHFVTTPEVTTLVTHFTCWRVADRTGKTQYKIMI